MDHNKQSAPRSRQNPHQHLITQFLQVGCKLLILTLSSCTAHIAVAYYYTATCLFCAPCLSVCSAHWLAPPQRKKPRKTDRSRFRMVAASCGQGTMYSGVHTLASPGEYDRMILQLRRGRLMPSYFQQAS